MIFKGLRFGMLLQLAIGPMCLMVFNTSASHGFVYGVCLMAAVALIDALYIALSCAGAAAVVSRPKVKSAVKLASGLVLALFGANTIAGAFGFSLLPDIAFFSAESSRNLFIQGLLLAASNPLTIVFWSGMFSAQMIENQWNRKQLFFFASGCVLSTVIFLTFISFLGSAASGFLPRAALQALNVIVGSFLIFFGVRLVIKKEGGETAGGPRRA